MAEKTMAIRDRLSTIVGEDNVSSDPGTLSSYREAGMTGGGEREYSWCCGAGGGVLEAFPDFAAWSAQERVDEALATGAEALVTACPWCERTFKDAVAESGAAISVYDLTDLALQAAGLLEAVSA
jgi:Cysteine-rich domain